MVDEALERNRRHAWARYYRVRADLEQMSLWAGELAEWLDALVDELPDTAVELVALCRRPLKQPDLERIRRYVAFHQAVPA